MGTELIERPNWGPPSGGDGRDGSPIGGYFGGRLTPGDAAADSAAPAAKEEGRPTFTAEELALLDPLANVDAEDVTKYKKLLSDGTFTPEDLARHYRLTPEEMEALQAPPAKPLKNIDAEIAEIEKVMREDRHRYDRELAPRYAQLLAERARRHAEAAESKRALQRSDGADLDPDLRAEWERQGGVAHNLGIAQRTVEAMVDGMSDDARTDFMKGFDALPAGVQTQVYRFLAIQPSGAARPASDEQMEEFTNLGEECASLLKSWGERAAAKLGVAQARIGAVMGALNEADREAAANWLDELPSPAQAGVVRALVGG